MVDDESSQIKAIHHIPLRRQSLLPPHTNNLVILHTWVEFLMLLPAVLDANIITLAHLRVFQPALFTPVDYT